MAGSGFGMKLVFIQFLAIERCPGLAMWSPGTTLFAQQAYGYAPSAKRIL
jgi:hypothetical protein